MQKKINVVDVVVTEKIPYKFIGFILEGFLKRKTSPDLQVK